MLYIPVANGKQLLTEEDKAETRDVIVSIDMSTLKDEEGNFGSGTIQHKYRVNKSKDNIKPVMKAVNLYSTDDTTKPYYKELVNTAYSTWKYDSADFGEYNKNHVGSSVYVEFDAEDVGSGVSSFIAKETLIKTEQGVAVSSITSTSRPQPASKNEETGKLGATYTIGTSADGIIKLEFLACDNSGNISNNSITYYVLKDTTIKNDSITFENSTSDLFVPTQEGSFLVNSADGLAYITALNNSVTGNQQTVSLAIEENSYDFYYYDPTQLTANSDVEQFLKFPHSSYDITLYWSYSPEKITTGPIVKENGVYTFTRDVDQVVYVKLVASDGVGNTKEVVKTIAPRLKISNFSPHNIDFENSDSLPSMCGTDGSALDAVPGGPGGAWLACFAQYDLTYNGTKRNYSKILTDFQGIMYGIEDIAQHPTGTIKVYALPKFGDVTAPVSSNYIEMTIQAWDSDPEDGAEAFDSVTLGEIEAQQTFIPYGKAKLSDALPSSDNALAEYGPISEHITVNVTPIQKTKLCKVEVSDYIRDGYNAADYIFKFYQAEVTYFEDSGYTVDENPTVYSTPTFYTPASSQPEYSKGFGIQIEAYSIKDKKWYRPKAKLGKQTIVTDSGIGYSTITEEMIENAFLCELYELNYDFQAPVINMLSSGSSCTPYGYNNEKFMKGGLYIFGGIYDEHGNLDEKSELSYYIIPNPDTKVSQGTRVYNLEELENYYSAYKKTMNYKPLIYGDSGENMTQLERVIGIPFGNIEDGYYTVVVVAADKEGNTAVSWNSALILNKGELPWKCERVNSVTNAAGAARDEYDYIWKFTLNTKNNPEIEITEIEMDETSAIKPSAITYVDKLRYYSDSYSCPWNDENEPTILDGFMSSDSYTAAENNAYYTFFSSRLPTGSDVHEYGPWVRLRSYLQFSNSNPEEELDTDWSNKCYYDINYFYCGTNDTICYSKNCIEGLNGIQVVSDRPVFAHTMYSDEPLTESKYDDNAVRIWENRGVETGVRVVNRSINEDNYHSKHFYYHENNNNDPNNGENPEYIPDDQNNGVDPTDPNSGVDPDNNGGGSTEPDSGDEFDPYPDDPVNPTGDPSKNPVPEDWHVVGSETYGNENLKSVPKGFYYTTIFHFADGSVAMTDIKQKR